MGARDLPPTADAAALVARIFAEFLAPPPLLTVTEWAELRQVLSQITSTNTGG